MQSIVTILTEGMDREIRDQVNRRYQALSRQLEYLKDNKDINLAYTRKHKWNSNKYRLLFALNSFFQIVIGPLSVSAQNVPRIGIGGEVPIYWGKIKFNSNRNAAVTKMYKAFLKLASSYGFNEIMLNKNQTSDIVYYIAKTLRENKIDEKED